jgi:acyl carrier protein
MQELTLDQAMTLDEIRSRAAQRRAVCDKIKETLVERLDLPIDPAWITDDQPLFGRGLELDSVDALELAIGIDDVAEVNVTDEQIGMFGSINRVVDYIEANTDGDVLHLIEEVLA